MPALDAAYRAIWCEDCSGLGVLHYVLRDMPDDIIRRMTCCPRCSGTGYKATPLPETEEEAPHATI